MLTLSCRQGICAKLLSQAVIIQEFSVHTVQKSLHPKFRASVSSAGGGEEVPKVANKMTLQKEGRVCSVCDRCVGGGAWPWGGVERSSNRMSFKSSPPTVRQGTQTHFISLSYRHRHTNLSVYALLTPRNCHCTLPWHTFGSRRGGLFWRLELRWQWAGDWHANYFPQAIVPLGWEKVCMHYKSCFSWLNTLCVCIHNLMHCVSTKGFSYNFTSARLSMFFVHVLHYLKKCLFECF